MKPDRARALELIKRNIEKSGFHIYLIAGSGPTPRFAYTIGLRESLGAELVLAGALFHGKKDEVFEIFHSLRKQLAAGVKGKLGPTWLSTFSVPRLGSFTLRKADSSWTSTLLLGAVDYYGTKDIDAYQIVPEEKHQTIDIPNMARAWNPTEEPVWRWLQDKTWPYSIPRGSEAMTDLAALRGAPITEACRWEENYWELFAGDGPDVSKQDARLVPLACLLGADPSLAPVVDLAVGEGLWRDGEGGEWNRWERGAPSA